MSCCRAGPCEEVFRPGMARADLARYRKRGIRGLTRRMLATAKGPQLSGARVLDIGGGVGALQADLLLAGADRGEVVELVGAYRPYAEELAAELGLTDRTRFRIHDLLDDPAGVRPADVVLLNRVVCCTPDGIELLGAAARLARHRLVVQFPRNTWIVRTGLRSVNLVCRVSRRSYRAFVHPRDRLLAAARGAGLEVEAQGHGVIWEYVTFCRPPADNPLPAAG